MNKRCHKKMREMPENTLDKNPTNVKFRNVMCLTLLNCVLPFLKNEYYH